MHNGACMSALVYSTLRGHVLKPSRASLVSQAASRPPTSSQMVLQVESWGWHLGWNKIEAKKKKIQWFCKSSGFAKGFLQFYLSKPMKTYENTTKIIVFMKIYDFSCVFIGFHRFWEVKSKEALSKTTTFAKIVSILFQPRSHPQLSTWRTFWEDVGSSWDTLGFWRRSGGLCLAPGGGPLRSCGGVLGSSGWLGGSGRLCLAPGREVSKLWELCGTLGNYLDSWGVLGNPLKLLQESAGLGKPWNLFNDPMQCL